MAEEDATVNDGLRETEAKQKLVIDPLPFATGVAQAGLIPAYVEPVAAAIGVELSVAELFPPWRHWRPDHTSALFRRAL